MYTPVEILVLGAGWTSTFVKDICDKNGLSYAGTSRSGRDSTIKFVFDPNSDDLGPYSVLPTAHTVVITFPITEKGAAKRLVTLYAETHGQIGNSVQERTRFIQLGTTSIWDVSVFHIFVRIISDRLIKQGKRLKLDVPISPEHKWCDRHSPVISTPRAEAEEELLSLSPSFPSTVFNLSGLWGGTRSPKNWVGKVAPSKEVLKDKVCNIFYNPFLSCRTALLQGSLHLIHGEDIARAIVAVHNNFDKAQGQRWILSDGRVYDWWDLASAWGSAPTPSISSKDDHGPQASWVRELMDESDIRALPRNVEMLGRALDSRDFWKTFDLNPVHAITQG